MPGTRDAGPTLPFEPAPLTVGARPEAVDAPRWARLLEARVGRRVRVRFGRARRDVLVARIGSDGALEVRMNEMFAHAPPEVREAVGRWLRSGRRARRAGHVLDAWIAEALPRLAPPKRPARTLEVRGRHHDLGELARDLRAREIGPDELPPERWPAIGWGARRRSRARRSLHLGSYDPETNRVRVHPVLDHPEVPRFFVRYVLFHELLHAAYPPKRGPDGRAVLHGPEMRRRELGYAEYPIAMRWQARNIERLLRWARKG